MIEIIAEYIWIDGNGNLRSKARTLDWESLVVDKNSNYPKNFIFLNHKIPNWNYDGSSTGQAVGNNSEITLQPCYATYCPFRLKPNILVMCETYDPSGKPALNNNRDWTRILFNKNLEARPWYGIEQEFFMINPDTNKPIGWLHEQVTPPQGQYYCSVGTGNTFGRPIIDKHYTYCLYAGLKISGINAEVAIGQWEYQIGPVEGIEAGDQLYLSRYILQRIAEDFNIRIDFQPKPLKNNWNGSGCHTNYSTLSMREGSEENGKLGIEFIKEAIEKLSLKHDEHMEVYGTDNELRMTGEHETSSFDKFTWGVAHRGASIRIPRDVDNHGKGYLEDRRPSSNMDPYLVTGILFKTTVLE
jgi:glutamine synthetase